MARSSNGAKVVQIVIGTVSGFALLTGVMWGMAKDKVDRDEVELIRDMMESQHDGLRREMQAGFQSIQRQIEAFADGKK